MSEKKLSEQMQEFVDQVADPDTELLECWADAVRALEEERDQWRDRYFALKDATFASRYNAKPDEGMSAEAVEALVAERDWLKANLKSAGQVIGLALTTSQGALEDRLSAALRREDTLRQLNDELNEEVLRLHRVLEAKEYGTP